MKKLLFLCCLISIQAKAWTRDDVLREMEPWIASCVARQDTKHTVFHGCWDWHSAVHGHWALFRISNALKDTSRYTLQAEQSLSPALLKAEEQTLARNLLFENPYGRSWFLRLAIDFERWAHGNQAIEPGRLRALGDLVAASLLQHFDSRPAGPDTPEYENASWAFYQLHAYFDFTSNAAARDAVERLIEEKFQLSPSKMTFASDRSGFFSLFGNWIFLVAKALSAAALGDFLSAHPIAPGSLNPIPVSSDHSLGLVWSRAWAFSALERSTSDPSWRKAFETHVAQGLVNHSAKKQDYSAYGHWVPQFAVYALTESLD